jgi:hypothetical protein
MAILRILELKIEMSLIEDAARGAAHLLLYYGGLKVESLRARDGTENAEGAENVRRDRGEKPLSAGANVACRAYSKQLNPSSRS